MSLLTLSGTVTVEKSSGSNPTFTISITLTPPAASAASILDQIDASSGSPGSYKFPALAAGQYGITFEADKLSTVTETVTVSAQGSNVLDVEMNYASSSSGTGDKLIDPLLGSD